MSLRIYSHTHTTHTHTHTHTHTPQAGFKAPPMRALVGARGGGRGGDVDAVENEKRREGVRGVDQALEFYIPLSVDPESGVCAPPFPIVRFRSTTELCVAFALFNLCVLMCRPLSEEERCRIRGELGEFDVSSLPELSSCALHNNNKAWRLTHATSRSTKGLALLEWVLAQTSGLFLAADPHHCVGLDAQTRLVVDCAEEHARPLTRTTLIDVCKLVPAQLTVYRLNLASSRNAKGYWRP